jgi:hypothetical protein
MLWQKALASRILIASNLETEAYVSLESRPSTCVYPCATSLALFLTTNTIFILFILNTHFVVYPLDLTQFNCANDRDGNGYPRPDTRWVFTLLGYVCGLNILSVGLLLGKKLHPMDKRVLERSAFTHTH